MGCDAYNETVLSIEVKGNDFPHEIILDKEPIYFFDSLDSDTEDYEEQRNIRDKLRWNIPRNEILIFSDGIYRTDKLREKYESLVKSNVSDKSFITKIIKYNRRSPRW